jgi:hypothetical protein
MRNRVGLIALSAALLLPSPLLAQNPNPVYDWIETMNTTVIAGATTPLFTSRNVGMVGATIFDAVNGIEKRYQPLVVRKHSGPHASARAAAIQGAYAMLLKLYPAQRSNLDSRRAASLAAIASGPKADHPQAIANGIAYGQLVADAVFERASHDGFSPNPAPPYFGAEVTGYWRPTAS